MLIAFIIALFFTVGVSALCSILEAMILSTTTADIERLKKSHPRRGERLEHYSKQLEATSSAILSLNTLANTLGATMVGGIAVNLWPDDSNILLKVSIWLAITILFFSEIIPKNIGVLYRPMLQPILIFPLTWLCAIMTPLSSTVGYLVKFLLRSKPQEEDSDEEIILLAEKSTKEGKMSAHERDMINNALSLDEILVSQIMTPRTVVHAIDADEAVGSLLKKSINIPFARIPVYKDEIDTIIGVVRRRDILKAKANSEDSLLISKLANKPVFIPDNASSANALQMLIKSHQQLAIAVDEYGTLSGVITIEDIMEHIIGQEIFENDDPAINMRDLARRRQFAKKHQQRHKQL